MQSMETKRVAVQWIGIIALALGALIAVIDGTDMLEDATDSDAGSSAVTRSAAQAVMDEPLGETRLEASWDAELPAADIAPVRSHADIRFLEMNTQLPGAVAPRVVSFDDIRFLEMNTLPESAEPYYPSPPEPRAIDAETPY
jgi:hypothetical protein